MIVGRSSRRRVYGDNTKGIYTTFLQQKTGESLPYIAITDQRNAQV